MLTCLYLVYIFVLLSPPGPGHFRRQARRFLDGYYMSGWDVLVMDMTLECMQSFTQGLNMIVIVCIYGAVMAFVMVEDGCCQEGLYWQLIMHHHPL